jgi:hypothetical protein
VPRRRACGNTASRAELAIGPPVALRGPGTRRTASGDPEEPINLHVKVAVMDDGHAFRERSDGHNLKQPLECTFLGICEAYTISNKSQ